MKINMVFAKDGYAFPNCCNTTTLILCILESGSVADVVYLDFCNAFDWIWDFCSATCEAWEWGFQIYKWIQSFLLDRRQAVVVEGHASRSHVESGVPQGTVLGPVLFLVHIIDGDVGTTSEVLCFADDMHVMRAGPEEDSVAALQGDLSIVYEGAASNNMAFNKSKFKVLQYRTNNRYVDRRTYTTPGGLEVEKVPQIKDLGIMMLDTAIFAHHILQPPFTAYYWLLLSSASWWFCLQSFK